MASDRSEGFAGEAVTGALLSESKVEAMISLLTDRSPRVVEGCRRALRAHAELAEPLLRDRLHHVDGDEAQAVRAALLDTVGARHEAALVALLRGEPDLEAGTLLIGRMLDASVTDANVRAALDAMADQVANELQGQREGGREPAVIIDVLARQNALLGAEAHRADALDATLHGVILRQRGLPLPLCITWLLVARRVRVPLRGVNMPGHFLVRYAPEAAPGRAVAFDAAVHVLDPFHRGRVVREEDCRRLLSGAGYPTVDVRLLDASDRDMLLRTLRNLVMIGSRRGDRDLAGRCARILDKVAPGRERGA